MIVNQNISNVNKLKKPISDEDRQALIGAITKVRCYGKGNKEAVEYLIKKYYHIEDNSPSEADTFREV